MSKTREAGNITFNSSFQTFAPNQLLKYDGCQKFFKKSDNRTNLKRIEMQV